MKTKIQIFKSVSNRISLPTYIKLTGQKMILPFYHTVSNYPKPHFSELNFFRREDRFLEDLDFFEKYYETTKINNLSKKKKVFHLSFDDGMSEMFSVVFPILKERKIDATFFLNTDFIDNKKMFLSHKRSLIKFQLKQSAHDLKKLSNYLETEESNVSQMISEIKKEVIIDELAQEICLNFDDYLNEKQPYLTTKQIVELKKEGFTIGNHGKTHRNFNTLNFEEQKKELIDVNYFLEKIGVSDFYFCFPYGDFNLKNEIFEWMYTKGKISKSFGISGLKNDGFERHYHRILMEHNDFSVEEIIKFEYFYYILKSVINRNNIRR